MLSVPEQWFSDCRAENGASEGPAANGEGAGAAAVRGRRWVTAMAGPERVDEAGIQEAEWTGMGLSWAWRGRERKVKGGVWVSGGSGGSWRSLGHHTRGQQSASAERREGSWATDRGAWGGEGTAPHFTVPLNDLNFSPPQGS